MQCPNCGTQMINNACQMCGFVYNAQNFQNPPQQYDPYKQSPQYNAPSTDPYQPYPQRPTVTTTKPKTPTTSSLDNKILKNESVSKLGKWVVEKIMGEIFVIFITMILIGVGIGGYTLFTNPTTSSKSPTATSSPPIAKISNIDTLKNNTIYTNTPITFDASESSDNLGISSYQWSLGDRTVMDGKTIVYTYTKKGTYNVVLTVTDNDGLMSTKTLILQILNTLPTASFTLSKTTFQIDETITLDASTSSDMDGSITSYSWDFGDSSSSTSVSTTHKYTKKGAFTVTLTVTDNDGGVGTKSINITVSNILPTTSFTASKTVARVGDTITFDASASSDIDGSITSYSWDFGDSSSSTGVSTTHKYTKKGTFIVALTVTDNDGGIATKSVNVAIPNTLPTASFTASKTTATISETITFDASSSSDIDGQITSYAWDFGDSSSPTGVSTTHKYTKKGTFTITLTVTDNDGGVATKFINIAVSNTLPTASFTASKTTATISETITFDASSSSDIDGQITSYAWDFGDSSSSSGISTSHKYTTKRTFTVTLTVTDNDGGIGTTTKSINVDVSNTLPTASFTASKTTFLKSETITFDASLSSDADGQITSYAWDFGDSSSSTGISTSHKYTKTGKFTVTLRVTDNDGGVGTTTKSVTVTGLPPIANAGSSRTVFADAVIAFDGRASTDPDGTITEYRWDFGDGSTQGVGASVTHKYTTGGYIYSVILTVTDNDGLTNTDMIAITVTYDLSIPHYGNLEVKDVGWWSEHWQVSVDLSILNEGEAKAANTIKITVQAFVGDTKYGETTKTYSSVLGTNQEGWISFSGNDKIDCGDYASNSNIRPTKLKIIIFYNDKLIEETYINT